jgi:PEP-CTERM motif-containing protein
MRAIALTVVLCSLATPVFASSFATEVVSYTAGSNVTAGYTDPNAALGSPARSTGTGPFDGSLTPFNAPYRSSDIVSIGAGGELTVRFDHPVTDDAAHPYGIDLIVFGNAFLGIDFNTGLADGTVFDEPAHIAVSQDGVTWFDSAVTADGLFPTLAYQDVTDPFGGDGSVPTSYTRPVNPALGLSDFAGKTTAQIAALYAGAGGGAGIDLSALGLPWIQYVRVFQSASDAYASDVDAFAAVPEPAAWALFALAALGVTWSRARRRRPSPRVEGSTRAR